MVPSPWIVRWSHLLAPGSTVLDVACGSGRHLAWFAAKGHAVTGIDRDLSAALEMGQSVTLVEADIEDGPWPLMRGATPEEFGAVVVTNYLWRPVLPAIFGSVRPGGVLLYETFTQGHEKFGRPTRPDFLLRPGELLRACTDWQIVAYECGELSDPARCVQRIAAVRPGAEPVSEPVSDAVSELAGLYRL